MPAFRSFRILCAILGAVGLLATLIWKELEWHLLWYTPLSIIGAYLFSLRHLFALKQRLDDLEQEGITDLDRLQERVEEEVKKYHDSVGEDQQLK
jgi:hypothetical protein